MEQIVGSVVGGLMGGDGGSSTQTKTREPWAPAQEWLKGNIGFGQQLQNQYMDSPFSEQQKQAYSNAFGMSDAYRSMLPQLLAGLGTAQFDRRNPLQRPQAMGFSGFAPQFLRLGAFQPTNQTQNARAAIPAPAAPVVLGSFSESYGSGGYDGGY